MGYSMGESPWYIAWERHNYAINGILGERGTMGHSVGDTMRYCEGESADLSRLRDVRSRRSGGFVLRCRFHESLPVPDHSDRLFKYGRRLSYGQR